MIVVGVLRQEWGQDRHQRDDCKDDHADDRRAVAQQAAPGIDPTGCGLLTS